MAKELIGTASKATVGVRGAKAVVVMPAYNAATTLSATLSEIPKGLVEKVILVDDASRDGTAWLASSLGLVVIAHPHNAGYGANQKTCYMEALREDADVIVMLHPDGQYDPGILDQMIAAVRDGTGDIVSSSRVRLHDRRGAGLEPVLPRSLLGQLHRQPEVRNQDGRRRTALSVAPFGLALPPLSALSHCPISLFV